MEEDGRSTNCASRGTRVYTWFYLDRRQFRKSARSLETVQPRYFLFIATLATNTAVSHLKRCLLASVEYIHHSVFTQVLHSSHFSVQPSTFQRGIIDFILILYKRGSFLVTLKPANLKKCGWPHIHKLTLSDFWSASQIVAQACYGDMALRCHTFDSGGSWHA